MQGLMDLNGRVTIVTGGNSGIGDRKFNRISPSISPYRVLRKRVYP